jgi:hypothetical protein
MLFVSVRKLRLNYTGHVLELPGRDVENMQVPEWLELDHSFNICVTIERDTGLSICSSDSPGGCKHGTETRNTQTFALVLE